MEDVTITPCMCRPAAQQLLQRGAFACAPVRPGLAVDVRLLEFTMKLFVRIAPNKSAMVGALQQHLEALGFKLPSDVSPNMSGFHDDVIDSIIRTRCAGSFLARSSGIAICDTGQKRRWTTSSRPPACHAR